MAKTASIPHVFGRFLFFLPFVAKKSGTVRTGGCRRMITRVSLAPIVTFFRTHFFGGASIMRRIVISMAVLLTVWLVVADTASALGRCKERRCGRSGCEPACCEQAACQPACCEQACPASSCCQERACHERKRACRERTRCCRPKRCCDSAPSCCEAAPSCCQPGAPQHKPMPAPETPKSPPPAM
jgi:hypothetical protein